MEQQTGSEPENKSPETEIESIEELKKALAEERARCAEEKEKCEANFARWQRAQADFQNYKRYTEQDRMETSKYANVNLLQNILPIIDDFERALAAIPAEEIEHGWVEGIRMIDRKFRAVLEKQGVVRIKAEGEEFDPRFMEAMTTGKGPKDKVVMVLEQGYQLQDKVIRPARVIVGNGEEEVKKEE